MNAMNHEVGDEDRGSEYSTRLWIIHFAFVAAVPIYMVLSAFILRPGMRSAPETVEPFVPNTRALLVYALLAFISLGAIILAFNVERWFKQLIPQRTDSAQAFINKRLTTMIIMDALFEAVAVYGLVGLFLGLQPWQAISLMCVALVFLLIGIVKIRIWIDEYRQRLRQEIRPA